MSDNQARRPNVIWIFGDQHRGQALSCMGDPNVNTPNLDAMSRQGAHFTNAVAGMPLCCPFRGSLITSRYPHQAVPGHEYPLDPELPTVATAFKEGGYHTAYFGKWHLDGFRESRGRSAMHVVPPGRRGHFDTWIGYDNNNAQWDCWVAGGEGDDAFHERLPGYETDCLTDMLLDYLHDRAASGNGDQPFFAALSVQPPHDPYLAPEEFMAQHNPGDIQFRPNVAHVDALREESARDLAGYYAQIENLDWNVGRVRDTLDELGMGDDTWVIFFSDHGDMHGSHGQSRKMTPYEEAIRVPMIIARGRSRYGRPGGRVDIPMNHVDIAPTSLGLCGLDVPDWMQGSDFSGAVVRGKEIPPTADSAFLQSVIPTCHGPSVDRPWRGIVTRDGWKYICLEHQPWMLFNLNDDPYEQQNLAHTSRAWNKRRELQLQLQDWIERTDDEFALPELPPEK